MSVLLVPVDGVPEIFDYPVDPAEELHKRGVDQLVSVALGTDGEERSTVYFTLAEDAPENPRARQLIVEQIGAHLVVRGLAAFTGLSTLDAVTITGKW